MITRHFIGIGRHIRDAFRNFFRNFGLSLSALASISVTLIVVSLSVLMGLNFNSFATKIESDVTAIAYINNEVPDEDIDKMQADLLADSRVEKVVFSSKDEELEITAAKLEGFGEIANQYKGEENPLYRVFYIQATDVEELSPLAADMKKSGDYFDVEYSASVIEKFIKLFDYARIIAVVIIGLLLLVTVFIIYNTIRITIYNRSVQVEIMKLIGASNYHITMPYIYEGILIGLFGSILPVVLTIFGYGYFYQEYADNKFIKSFFDLAEPYPLVLYLAAAILSFGVIVGVFGSTLSIRRFVRK